MSYNITSDQDDLRIKILRSFVELLMSSPLEHADCFALCINAASCIAYHSLSCGDEGRKKIFADVPKLLETHFQQMKFTNERNPNALHN